jgi:hypothetical protein
MLLEMKKKIDRAKGNTTLSSMTDFEALQAKIKAMNNLQHPFVDVWNCRAALAWTVFSEDGHTSHVERHTDEEMEWLGITNDMLHAAVDAAGGAINWSGHYPITSTIKERLERVQWTF